MLDGVFDFLVMVLVLAIVVGLGFVMILPLTQDSFMEYSERVEDKAMLREVKDYAAEIDGVTIPEEKNMSALEVILMTQIQDENLPAPKALTLQGGNRIEIDTSYRIGRESFGVLVWNQLPSKTARYNVAYDYRGQGSYDIRRK